MRVALLTLLCLQGLANAALAQTPTPRILVMPFAVQTDPSAPPVVGSSAWIGEAAALSLTEEFQALGLEAFSREDRVAAFDRLQLPLSSSLTRATTIRTGELVGASDVVIGDVRLGQRLVVRARLIRLDLARQSPEVEEQGPVADMAAVFARAADVLARSTGRTLPSARTSTDPERAEPVEGRRQPQLPADVFENYVKGLVAIAPAAQQRFLEAAYRKEPRDGRILMALWSVYTGQGLHAKALAVARNVPADSPRVRNGRFAAALSLIELGRLDEAFKELRDLNAQRASPVLLNALGIVQLRRTGLPEGGSPAFFFDAAVKGAPEDTDYLFNLGYAYARGHEPQAALFWLREAVRFDATNGDAHLVMSAVLESTGKTVEAQRELELANLLGTRRDVPTTTLRDTLAPRLERLRTDLDASISRRFASSIGTPARQEQQEVAAFYLDEGRRLFAARQDRDAINRLRRAVYLSPYQDEPHLLLGHLYQRAGRLTEAIDEFKVAIWCKESAATRLALAAALLESGDRPAARREVERALVLQPNSDEARALLKAIDG
jgi:tetratricopeptide (TPR) repeat protein